MKKVLFTIFILLFTCMVYGQEREKLGYWNSSSRIDLGGGKRVYTEILARSFKVERESNIIYNISGKDTISYKIWDAEKYRGRVVNGNWEDIFDINSDSVVYEYDAKKFEVKKVNEQIFDRVFSKEKDTVKQHIRFKKNGRTILKLADFKVFEDGKEIPILEIKKVRKYFPYGDRIVAKFNRKDKNKKVKVDPTWNWQPDATGGVDNYVSAAANNTNYGTDANFTIGADPPFTDTLRGTIKFNIGDSIPIDATINSAKIVLTVRDVLTAAVDTIMAYTLKRAWVEAQETYDIYSTGNSWQVMGGFGDNDVYKTDYDISVVDGVGTDDIDITNSSKKMAGVDSSRDNNGWLIKASPSREASGAQRINRYRSSDYGTAGERPEIYVYYTEATTPGVPAHYITYEGTTQLLADDGTMKKLRNH